MVSVEVDTNGDQQHEAGMDTVKDSNSESIGGAQVEDPITADETNANSIDSIAADELEVEKSSEEDQSNTIDQASPTPAAIIVVDPQQFDAVDEVQSPAPSSTPVEKERKSVESAKETTEGKPELVDTDNPEVLSRQENPSDGLTSTAVPVARMNSQHQVLEKVKPQEDISSSEAVDQDDTELASQQSSESITAKPSGFLESLTANFAPDTKTMWAQIFGPRYEDEDGGSQEDNVSNADSTSTRESIASKSSLQSKLARERKLDEQIQASQRRYRERVLRNAATNNAVAKRGRAKGPGRSQAPVISPLERAGFSLTQVRFCAEKALDETCKCFRHLHAVALEEAEDTDSPSTRGIYITQGELEQLLQELFDPQEPMSNTSKTLAIPLDFTGNDEALLVEGISMNTQLQASWFIPFGQLPQLRSMVMKITKRHLNEEKLAIVNRLLQKQLTLLPLSAKLQNLVLQLSNYQLKEPLRAPTWPEGNRSSNEVVQDLLTCIAVNENAVSADYNNFLHYLPVELVTKTPLSSVVGAQRLVFFRYFIDIIATERMKVQSNSSKSPPALSDEPPAKRKSQSGKRRKSSKRTSVGVVATPQGDVKVVTSILAAHGSLPITSEAGGANNETSPENELFEPPDHVGDECEKPVSQLQLQLELAINQFRQTLPSFDSDTLNPETRATYLAAMACHQSVLLMLENNIDVDSAMSDKLKHFIEALQAIQIKTSAKEIPAELLGAETEDNQLLDPPRFPPPYPESEEGDEERESGSVKTDFPPPYAITTPSYWTFNPSIPEPQSSIAKLASKSPNCKSAELRSRFMPKESPGVGAYNIHESEKVTFRQKSRYSFGAGGESSTGIPSASQHTSSVGKLSSKLTPRQRIKPSQAVEPPDDTEWSTDTTRVNVGSQCDDNHLEASDYDGPPPQYERNEMSEEKHSDDAIELGVESEMDRALRLQQRIFMNEFVQQVVSNQESPTYFVPRDQHTTDSKERSSSASKPYWATCEISPGIERLLHRQRRAPTSSKFRPPAATAPTRPRSSRSTKRVVIKAPHSPPRRQLDNDEHLAWAARISELYQPPVTEQ